MRMQFSIRCSLLFMYSSHVANGVSVGVSLRDVQVRGPTDPRVPHCVCMLLVCGCRLRCLTQQQRHENKCENGTTEIENS